MIKIEVKSTATVRRVGTSKRTGQPFEIFEQRGWLHGSKDYPVEVSFLVESPQTAFAPGFYTVGAECCEVDRYGNVALRLSKMKPIQGVKAA